MVRNRDAPMNWIADIVRTIHSVIAETICRLIGAVANRVAIVEGAEDAVFAKIVASLILTIEGWVADIRCTDDVVIAICIGWDGIAAQN